MQDVMLSDLHNCRLIIPALTTAIRLFKLTDCELYFAPTCGSIHLENCKNCTFIMASHQVRIHHTEASTFILFAAQRPIIEFCSQLLFSDRYIDYFNWPDRQEDCKRFNIQDESKNQALQVADFRWLRSHKNPSWDLATTEQLSNIQPFCFT
jgi:hypothetical protein